MYTSFFPSQTFGKNKKDSNYLQTFCLFHVLFPGMNALPVDCNALQSSTAKQTESKINSTVQKAKAAAPVIVVLDNFEVWQNTILTIIHM